MTDHCLPNELWQAARSRSRLPLLTEQHLAGCEECSTLWSLIQSFALAPSAPLVHAPSGWVEQAVSIAGAKAVSKKLAALVGKLRFDSWAVVAPATLRGSAGEPSRRLTWEAEDWSIDLRAENTSAGWNCTAQVLDAGKAKSGVEFRIGSLRIRTDDAGLATWSSARPPKKIEVSDQTRSLELGPLSWKPPKSS